MHCATNSSLGAKALNLMLKTSDVLKHAGLPESWKLWVEPLHSHGQASSLAAIINVVISRVTAQLRVASNWILHSVFLVRCQQKERIIIKHVTRKLEGFFTTRAICVYKNMCTNTMIGNVWNVYSSSPLSRISRFLSWKKGAFSRKRLHFTQAYKLSLVLAISR